MGIQTLPEGRLNHLQKKILFTLGFIAIYRIGVYVPIPGINTVALGNFFRSQGGNMLGMFNMFSGGALANSSIFALGVTPYISSSIIFQLLTVVVPYLEALSKEGEAGRRKITQYTRYGTVVLALIQGYMIVTPLSTVDLSGEPLVLNPSTAWIWQTVIALAAGTAFVMWLGEQITAKGVGNGISLIIFVGIVAGLPSVISSTYTSYTSQDIDMFRIILISCICIVFVAGVVFIEQGARQVPIQYAKRQVGRKVYGGQSSHLPIKVNTAGVIPAIFASSLLQFPTTALALAPNSAFSSFISAFFIPGGWLYYTIFSIFIIFFAFFYTTIVFKTDDIAENLKKHGGYIPGVRPGARTSEYLQKILSRLTLVGGIYLASISVLPPVILGKFNVQFYFGGTSLLIVVGVALETFRQIDAHRQSLRYDSFLKKGSGGIRPRRRGSF